MSLSRLLRQRYIRATALRHVLFCSVVVFGPFTVWAEDAATKWLSPPVVTDQLRFDGVRLLEEQNQPFQRFRFLSAADFQTCRIEAGLPALEPVEEFTAKTRVNSTHAGIQLGVRFVLPNQIDPGSGRPLTTWLYGERSTETSAWQPLQVSVSRFDIESQLVLVRSELAPMRIDVEGLYIDRCALLSEFSRGQCVIDAEPVTYGPVVRRPHRAGESDDQLRDESESQKRTGRIRLERNQVFLNQRPGFMQMMPDHGETPQQFRELGVNTVWTQDYKSLERLKELSDAGIMIAATPPHPAFDPVDFRRPLSGLLPLEKQMEMVDLIYLGTRVTPEQLPHLMAWARLVRSSDRVFRRPIMADVIGSAALASRQIDMVGIGVPSLHRNLTFGGFRNRILHTTRRASQMNLPWTWIQTESPNTMTQWRVSAGLPPLVVEPEQITMQVIAALSAGARAIAYWKTAPFGNGQLQESETGLAVALMSLHIGLLEQWLVSGQAQSYIAVDDGRTEPQNSLRQNRTRLQAAVDTSPVTVNPEESDIPRKPDGAVITGHRGSLVIVSLWDESSQFVPGHLYAREARLTATARETSSAAQITATGVIGQRRTPRPGGLGVTLKDLDQFGVILVSSSPSVFREMSRRVQQVIPQAAELRCQIARLKHQRVLSTCGDIDLWSPSTPPSASKWLKSATRMLRYAEAALQNDRFTEADRQAQGCMRALRTVQNLYWTEAIRHLPTPMASPYTVAFSSLPEHWKMMKSIESTQPSGNLLPPGEFHRQEMEQAGWRFPDPPDNVYSTRPQLGTDLQHNCRILQLAAWKPEPTRASLSTQPSMLVNIPPVRVEAGDIVEIRGRARRSVKSIRTVEEYPLMIFDSELGPEFAVRPALNTTWRSFHLYRQTAAMGELQISFGLKGSAEVHLDLDALTVRIVGRGGPSGPTTRRVSGFRVRDAGDAFPSIN